MITPTLFIGFGALAMKKMQEDFTPLWKPSEKDVRELEKGMNAFTKKIVNGRMQYPLELYLESKDYISFGEFGQIQVKNPLMYGRMGEIESLRQWIAEKEMERMFESFPEERVAYDKKRVQILASLRNVDKSRKTAIVA